MYDEIRYTQHHLQSISAKELNLIKPNYRKNRMKEYVKQHKEANCQIQSKQHYRAEAGKL